MGRTGPRVVAFGGGHGLAAALSAWRRITADLTAVVGHRDHGGELIGDPSPGGQRRGEPVPSTESDDPGAWAPHY